jgi:PRTRC genetic system protein B
MTRSAIRNPRSKIETDELPRLALLFSDESIFLHRFDERGSPVASYRVSTQAVAAALNPFGADTGLLSMDTLFWQSRGGDPRIGVWLPPGRRALLYDTGGHARVLSVPLPGLVFVGHRAEYRVWAARRRPTAPGDSLYLAPFSNLYSDARVCKGSAPFPRCESATMAQAVQAFFESSFNADLSGKRVRGQRASLFQFWSGLQRKRSFPSDRLLSAGLTLGEVMSQ